MLRAELPNLVISERATDFSAPDGQGVRRLRRTAFFADLPVDRIEKGAFTEISAKFEVGGMPGTLLNTMRPGDVGVLASGTYVESVDPPVYGNFAVSYEIPRIDSEDPETYLLEARRALSLVVGYVAMRAEDEAVLNNEMKPE